MSDEPTVLYEATDKNLTWRISLSDGQLVLAVETATGPLKQMAHWLSPSETESVWLGLEGWLA